MIASITSILFEHIQTAKGWLCYQNTRCDITGRYEREWLHEREKSLEDSVATADNTAENAKKHLPKYRGAITTHVAKLECGKVRLL